MEKIKAIFYALNSAAIDGTTRKMIWPDWVGYTFGALFIVIGLASFTFIPKAKRNMLAYKKEQLENYNKEYRKNERDYERTGMYLPAWERVKLFLPGFFGIVFLMLGIAFMVGNTLFHL